MDHVYITPLFRYKVIKITFSQSDWNRKPPPLVLVLESNASQHIVGAYSNTRLPLSPTNNY
jgi:hypothetical protein